MRVIVSGFLALALIGPAAVWGCGSSGSTSGSASGGAAGTPLGTDGGLGGSAGATASGGSGGAGGTLPEAGDDAFVAIQGELVVLAWNDLGMHCLNPRYDELVILPPYNTLRAQVILKGNPPQLVTSGVTVEYRIIGNTYSYGKKDAFGADFAQFWDYSEKVFGVSLEKDRGLNLDDPSLHHGLSGAMVASTADFHADGIPLTPVDDNGTWNPFQVAEVTVKDGAGNVRAQTRATVPTSDEIDCAGCHSKGGAGTQSIGGGQDSPFHNILASHDQMHGTGLVAEKPVLCASCHGSPALGAKDKGSAGLFLSAAIHSSHAPRGATCYSCHPGSQTQCSRSVAHTTTDGNCTTCHGTMEQVGQSAMASRTPWAQEPACVTCHAGIPEVDTGAALYRNSAGHGGVKCEGCHGSPHAMVPSREAADNYQALQYQHAARTIGSCGACHASSRGASEGNFAEVHAGPGAEHSSACNVCHTQVSADTSHFPHAFQWKNRPGSGSEE